MLDIRWFLYIALGRSTGGDSTPGGINDVILMADNTSGILMGDGSSFIKLAG